MRMTRLIGVASLFLLAAPALALDKFYVVGQAEHERFSDDLEDEIGWRLGIGAALSEKWGLEIAYDLSEPTVKDTFSELDATHIGADLLYYFGEGDRGRFFGLIGAGVANLEGDVGLQSIDEDGEYGEIGVGYLRRFTRSGFAFRFDYRYRQSELDEGEFNTNIFAAGLHIPLGSHEEEVAASPPPPPPPPPPAPEPLPPPAVDIEPQAPIILRGVQFDFDKATLRPESTVILDEAAKVLGEQPQAKVLIMGHTCNIGTDEYNLGLSKRRAKSVVDYLSEHGVGSDRMASQGFGESKPIADNSTKAGREENRRTELQIRDEGTCYTPAPGDGQDDKGCAVLP